MLRRQAAYPLFIVNSPFSKEKSLETRIKKAASNGIITCAALRKIAEEMKTSYSEAGRAADNLKIKVRNCDLGCF